MTIYCLRSTELVQHNNHLNPKAAHLQAREDLNRNFIDKFHYQLLRVLELLSEVEEASFITRNRKWKELPSIKRSRRVWGGSASWQHAMWKPPAVMRIRLSKLIWRENRRNRRLRREQSAAICLCTWRGAWGFLSRQCPGRRYLSRLCISINGQS